MTQNGKASLDFIAAQLRKPNGAYAKEIADRMDSTNEFIFDLTLETMGSLEGMTVLEIGYGSGAYIHKSLSGVEKVELHGIDYSEEMLKLATENNQDAIESGRLKLLVGSSDKLPYDDNYFDKVFCNMVIFFWDEPEKHLQEVHRTLRLGGKFYSGFRTRSTMEQFPFTKHGFHLYEPEEWVEMLKESGFKHVETRISNDPALLGDNGKEIRLESVCVVAEK